MLFCRELRAHDICSKCTLHNAYIVQLDAQGTKMLRVIYSGFLDGGFWLVELWWLIRYGGDLWEKFSILSLKLTKIKDSPFFFRVVGAGRKICSNIYLLRFFKIYPIFKNIVLEGGKLNNIHIVNYISRTGLQRLLNPAISDGRTWSKFGEHG